VLRIVNTALNKINFGVQIDHRKTDQYAAGNILCNSGTPEEAQALAAIEVNLVRFSLIPIAHRFEKIRKVSLPISSPNSKSMAEAPFWLKHIPTRAAITITTWHWPSDVLRLMQAVSVEVDPQGLVEADK